MPKLAEAYVDVTAKDGKFKAAMKGVEAQTHHTAKAVEQRFVQMGSRIGTAMYDAGKRIAAALTVAGIAGAGAALKLAADWEQAEIAFTTMLGSAQKARKFMGELESFAAKTPFELPGLVDASRKLLAFGFAAQDIIPMMTAIGDGVSGLGGGAEQIQQVTRALGQMQAKGKVSAEEMMQIAEIGIPGWQMLAERIGTDIPTAMKLAEQGGIKASTGINAILVGMNARFGGMMDKQSKTIEGRWSTLKDSLASILRKIGLDLNRTFHISGGMERLAKWFETNQEAIRKWAKAAMEAAKRFGEYLVGALPKALEIILRIPQAWEKVAATMKATGAVIGGIIKDIGLRFQQLQALLRHDPLEFHRLGREIKANTASVKVAVQDAKKVLAEPWRAVTLPKMPTMPGLPAMKAAGKSGKPEEFTGLTGSGSIADDVASVQAALSKKLTEQKAAADLKAQQDELSRRKSAWEQVLSLSESFTIRMTELAQGETAGRIKAIDLETAKRREAIEQGVRDETRKAMLLKALDLDVAAQKQAITDEEARKANDEAKAEAESRRNRIGFAGSLGDVWRSAMTAGARLGVPDAPAVQTAKYSKEQVDLLKQIAEYTQGQLDLAKTNVNKLSAAEALL